MDLVNNYCFGFVIECYIYLHDNVIRPRSQPDSEFLFSPEVEVVGNGSGPDETISVGWTDNQTRFEYWTVYVLVEEAI